MSAGWKALAELGASLRQLFQSGQRVACHGVQIELANWLIERPKGVHVVGIQFKQLPDEPLRDFGRCQIYLVQSAKQR